MTAPDSPGGEPPRTAAQWFGLMQGPASDDERAAFEAWRSEPANAAAYARLTATWDQSMFLANRPIGRNRDLSLARRWRPGGALLAAGVAGLVIVSGSIAAHRAGWFSPDPRPGASISMADAGAIRTIKLPDGSRVTLDRGAAIRDLSSARERRIALLRGRARFEVAHDEARRFIVDAGQGEVIAHGTVFDVALEGPAVRVILVRGSVEVRGRGHGTPGAPAARMLAPGEQLVVQDGPGQPTRADGAALAWPDAAMISFDAAPLRDAIAAFNRTSVRAIRLEAPGAASRRLSGAFRRNDPQGFADAVTISFGLEATPGPDGSIILREPMANID